MNETWVHLFTLETKQQSKQCVESDGSAPKKHLREMSSLVFFGKLKDSVN